MSVIGGELNIVGAKETSEKATKFGIDGFLMFWLYAIALIVLAVLAINPTVTVSVTASGTAGLTVSPSPA
jgi:hypothetical protein